MQRRRFLIACGALAAPLISTQTLAKTVKLNSVVIPDAYMLWYNRPSMIKIKEGLVIAYTTSTGDLCVTHLATNLQVGHTVNLHHFDGVSDHSAPSIVRIPKGRFAGHILVFFSNHASELFFVRSKYADSIESWDPVYMLDSGRVTYPAAFTLADGTIGLQYTLQHRNKHETHEQWRTTVHRTSSDGGTTWSDPAVLLDFGPNQFPYSTPVAVSPDGRCAVSYSIYSPSNERHRGLWVLISDDGFTTFNKVTAVLDVGTYDFIPYELKWKNNQTLMLSYSMSKGRSTHANSAVAYINTIKHQVHTYRIGPVKIHTYPGGAALLPDSNSVIYSPINGGLTHFSLRNKTNTLLVKENDFASPFVFKSESESFLVALKNPSIKTTRNFIADLLIHKLPI